MCAFAHVDDHVTSATTVPVAFACCVHALHWKPSMVMVLPDTTCALSYLSAMESHVFKLQQFLVAHKVQSALPACDPVACFQSRTLHCLSQEDACVAVSHPWLILPM